MKNVGLFLGTMAVLISFASHAEDQKPIPKGLRTASVVVSCAPAALITGAVATYATFNIALGSVLATPTDTLFYLYSKTSGKDDYEAFQFAKGWSKGFITLVKNVETDQFDGKSMCQKMQDRAEQSRLLGEIESNSQSINNIELVSKSDIAIDSGKIKKSSSGTKVSPM